MGGVSIKKCYWKEVSSIVAAVNPVLAELINSLDPGNKFPLYRARYPFGYEVVSQGYFHLPGAEKCRKDFLYSGSGLPLGVVLSKAYQESLVHLYTNETLPLGVVYPGSIFALWEHMDAKKGSHPIKLFNVNAGAKSLFMLPNIGNDICHRHLKRDFGVTQQAPKSLVEHWEIFKKIISRSDEEVDWHLELLFFSEPWLDNIKNNPAWKNLYCYLLNYVWEKSAFDRNRFMYEFAISCIHKKCNLKPNPYIADTFAHLILMASGCAAGFSPANDNSLAPIDVIRKAYLESYGMKQYAPTIMQPSHFDISNNHEPVYYSFQFPTTLEFSRPSRKLPNTLYDLAELKHITNLFVTEIRSDANKLRETALENIVNKADFQFFHNKADVNGEILLTNQIPKSDPSFLRMTDKEKGLSFAENGGFVRGCVQIKHKEKNDA